MANKRQEKQELKARIAAANLQRLEKFVETTDDWYPNFEGDRVSVRLLPLINHATGEVELWRLAVSGNDDTRMELDLQHYSEAIHLYENIQGPVTYALLKSFGFTFQ